MKRTITEIADAVQAAERTELQAKMAAGYDLAGRVATTYEEAFAATPGVTDEERADRPTMFAVFGELRTRVVVSGRRQTA